MTYSRENTDRPALSSAVRKPEKKRLPGDDSLYSFGKSTSVLPLFS